MPIPPSPPTGVFAASGFISSVSGANYELSVISMSLILASAIVCCSRILDEELHTNFYASAENYANRKIEFLVDNLRSCAAEIITDPTSILRSKGQRSPKRQIIRPKDLGKN
jgi:hypothetical protein